MHSQKDSEIRRDLTETSCPLATATCLQHPEGLARPQISAGTIRSSAKDVGARSAGNENGRWAAKPLGAVICGRSQPITLAKPRALGLNHRARSADENGIPPLSP